MRSSLRSCLHFILSGRNWAMAVLMILGSWEANAQVVIFSENVGTPAATTAVASYAGWQNTTPISFSGSSDVRISSPSNTYTNFSGSGNVFFTNTTGKDLLISGINSSGYTSLTLSFGHYKSTTAGNNELNVEVSADGVTYVPLTYSRPTGAGTSVWLLVNATGSIPSTSNLRIRFTQNSTTTQFRIDDIKLTGQPACAIPAIQASNINTPAAGFQNLNIQWTNGNGSGRIVLMNTVNSFADPVNGTDPPADSYYTGSGQQVVFNGNSNSVNITGLDPCREYWFRVYEFNCSGTSIFYNTTTTALNPVNLSTSSTSPSALTLASENFESTSTWNYTSSCAIFGTGGGGTCVVSVKPAPFGYLSSKALVKTHTVNNGSAELESESTIDFNQVAVPAGATNIKFAFRLASLNENGNTTATTGAGHDNGDFFSLYLQLNASGTYAQTFTETGANDKLFGYQPDKLSSLSWDQNVQYITPTNDYNYFTVSIPDGTSSVNVRYVARNNRIGENWCIDNMVLTTDIPSISTVPNIFTIAGNSSFCAGSTGTLIGLSGSQTGVNYQLFLNGAAIGSPVPGTGNPLDFGYQAAIGTYTVVASNLTYSYCHSDMLNPLTVSLKPSPVIVSITPTPASCGTDNGSLVVTAGGGTPPYQYSIDNGATWQASASFAGLAAGNYFVKVKDANCESLATTATVTLAGSTITYTVAHQNVKCYGQSNGTATVTGSGGVGSLSYTWNTSPAQNGPTAINLSVGTYICTITDGRVHHVRLL